MYASGPAGQVRNEDAPILIYPEGKTRQWMLDPADLDADSLARIRADCAETGKAFYEATITKDGVTFKGIGKRVADRPW